MRPRLIQNVPGLDPDGTPFERLRAFAYRIITVPKSELEKQVDDKSVKGARGKYAAKPRSADEGIGGPKYMISEDCGRMTPLYEAMTVCSSTIEWLEKEDQKRGDYDLQACLAKLVKVIEEFVEFVKFKPMREVPATALSGLVWCVGTLNSMTELVVRKTRELLPNIDEEFRQTVAMLLNQLDSLSSRVEDILEAWDIGANHEAAEALDETVLSICRPKTEIRDWREELELISD